MTILAICVMILAMLTPSTASAADGDLVIDIVFCESSFRPHVLGDDGKSYGIAQFRKETFYEFAAQAKTEMVAAGMWPAHWRNPTHQLFLLGWGIDHGHGKRWTCYRKIMERRNAIHQAERQKHPRKSGRAAGDIGGTELRNHHVANPILGRRGQELPVHQ